MSARRISVNIAIARADHPLVGRRPTPRRRRRTARRRPDRRARPCRSSRSAERACVCQRSVRGSVPIASHSQPRSSVSNTSQYAAAVCVDGATLTPGELDDVERRCASAATRTDRWATVLGHSAQPAARPRWRTAGRAIGRADGESSVVDQLGDRRAGTRRPRAAIVERRPAVAQQPQRAALDHAPRSSRNSSSWVSSLTCGRAPRSAPTCVGKSKMSRAATQARDHVDHAGAGVLGHPVVEGDARQVDHLVGDLRGDDLPAQPVVAGSRGR